MIILSIFLSLVSVGFGIKNQHLEEKLTREKFLTTKIVEQCGEEWLNKPLTNKDYLELYEK